MRRNELAIYLRTLHFRAINVVLTCLEEVGIIPTRPADDSIRLQGERALNFEALVNGFNSRLAGDLEKPLPEILGMVAEAAAIQINFIASYNSATAKQSFAWRTILLEFPAQHSAHLERLMFPDWYTACFVRDPMQASMWGVYADSHRGVCLKFRSHNNSAGRPGVRLKTATGLSGGRGSPTTTVYGQVLHELHEVTYAPRFTQIDFFRSLGRVTAPMLNRWCRDSAGTPSDRVLDILGDSQEWCTQYWEAFRKSMTTKLEDWRHESEVRCALHSSVVDLTEKSARKLEYDFADLEGIIFGLLTSNEEKINIARIIEQKCRDSGRKQFEFRQAYYASWSGKMESIDLALIKFS